MPHPTTRLKTKFSRPLLYFFLAALTVAVIPPGPSLAQSSRTFPQTGKTVAGRFLQYWDSHGGLAQQGYPISDVMQERSADGKTYTVQYFERTVFELHPENQPPYDVLLSRLGYERYRQKYGNAAPAQKPSTASNTILVTETGKHLGGAFLDYWQRNGSVAQQGYPLTEEFLEKSDLDGDIYTVQYFERAVFELHPDNSTQNILLTQLGTLTYNERYTHAAAGRIEPTGNMSTAHSCHSSTLLPNGKVLIAGGMIREGNYTAAAELYDPSTGRFAPTGSMSAARACHSATLLNNGKVLIVAGSYGSTLNSAELYNPATGKFTPTGSMLHERDAFAATLLPDGQVLITGGYDSGMLASAELYDPTTGRFTAAGNMTEPRAIHVDVVLPDGLVLITGGGSSGTVLTTAEIYDPITGKFTKTGNMTLPRYKHAATALADGKVLITGGSNNRDWRGRYAGAEIYDPQTGTFTGTGNMALERFKLREAVATLLNNRLLVAGGGDMAEIYNPTTQRFDTVAGSLQAPRFYQTATTLPNGSVLISGGYDTNIASTTRAWLYRP